MQIRQSIYLRDLLVTKQPRCFFRGKSPETSPSNPHLPITLHNFSAILRCSRLSRRSINTPSLLSRPCIARDISWMPPCCTPINRTNSHPSQLIHSQKKSTGAHPRCPIQELT